MDGMIQKTYVFDKANYISLICKFEGQHAVPSNLNWVGQPDYTSMQDGSSIYGTMIILQLA